MIQNSFQTGVSSSKDLNPDKLPVSSQIRIDLDFHSNGNLARIEIHYAHSCHMGEYRRAIGYLEWLQRERTSGPEARAFIRRLCVGLAEIEHTRETLGGAAYPALLNRRIPDPIETPVF